MARSTPPVRRMLDAGLPVGAGTDTRAGSYNPWLCLYWLVTGRTVGGTRLYGEENRLSRQEALGLLTTGGGWFANDSSSNGMIREGAPADFFAPAADYFTVAEDDIRFLTSHLTVLGGRVVHADGIFRHLAPPAIRVAPDWSPVRRVSGYTLAKEFEEDRQAVCDCPCGCGQPHIHRANHWVQLLPSGDENRFWNYMARNCWM